MRRATTPTHTFVLTDLATTDLKRILITYSQRGQIILEKDETACTIKGREVSVGLTQDESNRFSAGGVDIQLRVLTHSGSALASQIFHVPVANVLNDEVLT